MSKSIRSMAELRATDIGANARLYVLCVEIMRGKLHAGPAEIARLNRALKLDPSLLDAFIEEAGHPYLDRIATDIGGKSGGDQVKDEIHTMPVPAATLSDDSRDHSARVTQASDESRASDADGGDLKSLVAQPVGVSPVREPSIVDLAAARRVAHDVARTIFDSTELRGKPLTKIAIGELASFLSLNEQDNALIRQMMRHTANANPLALIPDVFKASDIERFKQKAAEIADAL